MKNIVITGITGFVGSHLADFLLESEPDSIIYGFKRPNSSLDKVSHIENKIRWINGDLTDFTSVIKLIEVTKPSEIYHLGALSWVTPSWDMPSAYMDVNAIGTINLLEAIRFLKSEPKIFVSCTPEEFGNVEEKDLPITENSPIHPLNPYAASKVAQDMVCITWAASYNMQIIRTRAFNHEGSRRDKLGANASFAYQIALIEKGLQDPVIKVGNLNAKRNFTDVRDIVRAYHLAMNKCDPGELYLIGSNNIYTMKECLEFLISLSSVKNISYEQDESRVRPTELMNFVGDFSKFNSKTGWSPKISFEDTMLGVLEYWRKVV